MTQPEDQGSHEGQEPDIALDVDWSPAGQVPVLPANQFLAQTGTNDSTGWPEGLYLSIGHIAPPVIFGSESSRRRALDNLGGQLSVNAHGRYFLTRDQVRQLIRVLTEVAGKLEAEAGER